MMTVAELIELLKTFPQDIPVTGYDAHENTSWVTTRTVQLETVEGSWWTKLRRPDGRPYEGQVLDIMGDLSA
jgi:hypothetical protein